MKAKVVKSDSSLLGGLVLVVAALVWVGACPSCAAQPANDMFAQRTVITGTNIAVTCLSLGATREDDEPYHAGGRGGASVWWSWTAPWTGTVTISTAGSSFDTLLGVYTGTEIWSLTEVASNDDQQYPAIMTSQVVFDVSSNETYQIAVDGYDGISGTVHLALILGPTQPPPAAPSWRLPSPAGVMVSSSGYAGKVVILDFWATWCGPCKAEMPDLVALQEKYRADGLVIVGADTGWSGDTAAVVQSFLDTWTPAINYQIVMSDAALMQAYGGIPAIPSTFIIDRQNILRKKFVGTQPRSVLEGQIIPLLYGNTRLESLREGNQVTLRWPATAAPFTLESSSSVANPSWSAWPTLPAVVGGTNTVQVPLVGAGCCFRLRMAY